jgi:hypothetical protein
MPLLISHRALSPAARRTFGIAVSIVLWLVAYMLHTYSLATAGLLLFFATCWLIVYYCWPASQPKLIRGWQWLTWPLAWVVGHSLLACVYFGILLPIGLWRRSANSLRLRQTDRESNWQSRRGTTPDEYFRLF